MAALTPTFKTPVMELHGRLMQTFTVAVSSNAAGDEWVVTDLGLIDAVVGWAIQLPALDANVAPTESTADTDPATIPIFSLNSIGTGTAATVLNGALGIEMFERDVTLTVTVIGKLAAQR